MVIEKHTLKVTTTGSAGTATGESSLALPIGRLVGLYLNFHASAPSTTDTIISSPGNPASKTILTLTNINTDAWYFPKEQDDNDVGAAVSGSYSDPLIHSNLLIALAQADALTDALEATIYLDVA